MTGDQDDVLAARHRQRYDTAVEVRDGLHAEVIAEANARREQVLEAIEAVRTGRCQPRKPGQDCGTSSPTTVA